jgi:hypothetical protein
MHTRAHIEEMSLKYILSTYQKFVQPSNLSKTLARKNQENPSSTKGSPQASINNSKPPLQDVFSSPLPQQVQIQGLSPNPNSFPP